MTDKLSQLKALRAPFPPEVIGKLPRGVGQGSKSTCKVCGGYHAPAQVHLSYVGHAEVTDRLLSVDPEWTWEPLAYNDIGLPKFVTSNERPSGLWIKLTILGVTRLGYGSVEPGKADAVKELIGDAIRNAAMRFGVALDLWAKGELESFTRSEEAEGTQEVTPPSGGTSRPGAVPAPSAPPTTHLGTAETQVMDRSAKGWVHELVRQYGDERVAEAAKKLAVSQNRRVPKEFKSLESWSVADLMLLAEDIAKPSDVAGSVSGTDAGGAGPPPPGTPSPEEHLDLIDRAKRGGLIRFSDIAKHSAVFLKADAPVPTTWGALAGCPPEVLAELVDTLKLRERVDPKQGSLT